MLTWSSNKTMMAMWQPTEATEEKTSITSDDVTNGDKQELKYIKEALKNLSELLRFFRTVCQWSATYDKFAVIAQATTMMTCLQLTASKR